MAPLRNVRHEKYCQALLGGKSATAAYEEAGYVKDDGNAARLRINPRIEERLAELQAEVATKAVVTVESICRELDEANAVAKERGQASAMVSASALRAKLAGLLVEKVEVGGVGAFDKCTSIEEVADEMIQYQLPPHAAVTAQDRQGLVDLLYKHANAVEEYIAAIKARPINPEYIYKARRTELARIGNGRDRH
jgi:hypothetical protein